MSIRICMAGATGWAGSEIARRILASSEFQLTGAIARRDAGRDIGEMCSSTTRDLTRSRRAHWTRWIEASALSWLRGWGPPITLRARSVPRSAGWE